MESVEDLAGLKLAGRVTRMSIRYLSRGRGRGGSPSYSCALLFWAAKQFFDSL
jgi:hypothetical protein